MVSKGDRLKKNRAQYAGAIGQPAFEGARAVAPDASGKFGPLGTVLVSKAFGNGPAQKAREIDGIEQAQRRFVKSEHHTIDADSHQAGGLLFEKRPKVFRFAGRWQLARR